MGIWGINLYEDDITLDVKNSYIEKLKEGKDNEQAMLEMLENFAEMINDEDKKQLFWFALADTQWELGRLNEYTKKEALNYLNNKSDLKKWKQDLDLCKKRQEVLENLKEKLMTAQPKEKRMQKYRIYKCNWKLGDVFAYQLKSELSIKNKLYGKYLIIQKIDEENCIKDIIPIVRVKITEDENIPQTEEEINKLEYVEIWACSYEERLCGLSAIKPISEQVAKLSLKTDEYGFFPEYRLSIFRKSKKVIEKELIYLGNYKKILPPKNEFVPINNIELVRWQRFEETIIQRYIGNNKHKFPIYNTSKNNELNLKYEIMTDIEYAIKRNLLVTVKIKQNSLKGYLREVFEEKLWIICVDENDYYNGDKIIEIKDIISVTTVSKDEK